MSLNILALSKLTEKQTAAIYAAHEDVQLTTCKSAEAKDHIADADILLAWGQTDLRPLLPLAPKLKWVHALSAGVENLLSPELAATNIILTNSRGIHGIPISEHVLGIMLGFTRRLFTAYDQQKNKQWKKLHEADEIYEKSIAIIGLGSIGRAIAKRAKSMGMTVLATKHKLTTELFVDALYPPEELAAAISTADFVVVTLPLTEETTGLFTLPIFQKMKSSAFFINVSRGSIVNEKDLAQALQENLIRGAALDVFQEEPLPESSPLWDLPNLLITPHCAAISPYYMDRTLKIFTENLSHFLQENNLINVVDKKRGY
jgi:D-2-hydroxyacid dehydrogenase (NADP+)